MKKITLILAVIFSISAFAQPPRAEKMKERIKAQKVAFLTSQLNLTAKEAQSFWPIYNAYEKQMHNIKFKELRPIKQKMRNEAEVSEAEAEKLLEQLITAETKMFRAKLKLMNDLSEVISIKKLLKLKVAEENFNRKLLERLRGARERHRN